MEDKIEQLKREIQSYKEGYDTVVMLTEQYENMNKELLNKQINSKCKLRVLEKQKEILQKQASFCDKDVKELQALVEKFNGLMPKAEAENAKFSFYEKYNKTVAEVRSPEELKIEKENLEAGLAADKEKLNKLRILAKERELESEKLLETKTKLVKEVSGNLQAATIEKRKADELIVSLEKELKDLNTHITEMQKHKELLEKNFDKFLFNNPMN